MTTFPFECPSCKEEFAIEVPETQSTVPHVRSLIEPIGNIKVYRITSDDMRIYLSELIKLYAPGTQLEVAPLYCQKKKARKGREMRGDEDNNGGYACIRIAFSEHILERPRNKSFYASMGDTQSSPRVLKSVLTNFIRKFEYNKKQLDDLVNDYRAQEELELMYGITNTYLREIRAYAIPISMPTETSDNWIIFSARPELIIRNMLENPEMNAVDGTIDIGDRCYLVNKGNVEFIVNVHPKETTAVGNPLVRKIMMKGN